jgi:hypothetical protein
MSSELKKVYTITFGDVAENHAKMQKIGTLHENGYSIEKLIQIQEKLNGYGLLTEMVDLNVGFDETFSEAKVLVIRKGAQFILGEETTEGLIQENDNLTMDKKALMRGKVVNKVARWNLCFADEDQEPNYDDGKGRVVAWKHIPRMSRIRQVISEWTEDTLLNGEANYYYDISQCGIGFHGDGERRKVFAVRMGETMPLYFKWYQNSVSVGEPFELVLNDGDMYIMSEKAVGFDWLKKKIPTLRHSTGCSKFTGINTGIDKKEELKQKKEQEKMKKEQEKMKKEQEKMKKEQEKEELKQKKEQEKEELKQKKEQDKMKKEQEKEELKQKKEQDKMKKEQEKEELKQKKEQDKMKKEQEKQKNIKINK